jgi:polysaccharide export outer membrane protein
MKKEIMFRGNKLIVLAAVALMFVVPAAAQNGPDQHASGMKAQPTEVAEATDADVPVSGATTGKAHDPSYLIGADDILAVNVWKEAEVSRTVPVRSDGKISLPLAGEVQAAGLTPKQLETEVAKKLESYISEPEVTVIVQEIRSRRFNILGQVAKPGTYLLTNSTTVLDAIAMAGGFRDFAKKKSIYVLRANADGTEARLPFNYKEVIKGEKQTQNVRLQPHDTVVIP